MPLVFSPVVSTCSEKEGSPHEEWTDQGLQATVELTCPWAVRHALVTDLLANARPYPHLTSTILRASAASIVPHSTKTIVDGQGNNYESAHVTVHYGTYELVDPGGGGALQIFSEELTPNGEFLTLPEKNFRWISPTGGPLEKEEAPGKLMLSIDFIQTQYQMPSLHIDLVDKTNHTNADPITASMLGFTFPPDTLLYAGSSPARTISTTGSSKWTVAKKFCYRATEWNKHWNTFAQTWDEIYIAGGARYFNFPPADFSNILV